MRTANCELLDRAVERKRRCELRTANFCVRAVEREKVRTANRELLFKGSGMREGANCEPRTFVLAFRRVGRCEPQTAKMVFDDL